MAFRFVNGKPELMRLRPPLQTHFDAIDDRGSWTMRCRRCNRMWILRMKENYTTEELSHFVRHIDAKCNDIPSLFDYIGDE